MVPAPARGSFTVNVLNATGKDGMAASVAKGLSQRKFSVGSISNAPETWYVTQPAVIHYGPSGLDQALLVQQQIPGADLFEDEGRGSKSVDVVVGLGYKDLVPLPPRFDPLPSEITMNVYNTTFRTGLASVVANQLKGRGFKVKDVSNDPLKTLQMGTALIRYGEEGDLAAKIVAQHIPGATHAQGHPGRHRARRRDRQRLHRAGPGGAGAGAGAAPQAGDGHGGPSLRGGVTIRHTGDVAA